MCEYEALRGVIFDLGGTLLDFCPGGDWREMEETGTAGLYEFLSARGYALPDLATVKAAVFDQINEGWFSIGQGDETELALCRQLELAAGKLGISIAHEDLAGAEASYIAPVQETVALMPGAVEVLEALRGQGLRLALISNTMWPAAYHDADLARFGLLDAFEARFYSADEGVWKPSAEIFNRALSVLDLPPEAAAYVGDSKLFDVQGAKNAGMRGVWIENDDTTASYADDVRPDAIIRHLRELLPIVQTWS
jgi:HAD superfamily hydrolase (TIGR01509 family)